MVTQKLTLSSLLLGWILVCSGNAFAAEANVKISCGHDQQAGYWWNYCDHVAEGSTSKDVIYYFHGIQGSEYEWQYSPQFQKIYALWGASAPTVVTVSYGSIWLLAEKNESSHSGLYEHFLNTALPYLEKQLNLQPIHRMMFGLSMGGFNAAQVYLKNPELFSRFAFACPAITTVGPHDSNEAIQAYTTRTHASSAYVSNALQVSAAYFPSQASWEKAAPITLAQQRTHANYPPLFVSGGMQDQYGFEEGAKAFVDAASANGAQASWEPLTGPHCTFDAERTALFLIAN